MTIEDATNLAGIGMILLAAVAIMINFFLLIIKVIFKSNRNIIKISDTLLYSALCLGLIGMVLMMSIFVVNIILKIVT